jgi:hypothetical protein
VEPALESVEVHAHLDGFELGLRRDETAVVEEHQQGLALGSSNCAAPVGTPCHERRRRLDRWHRYSRGHKLALAGAKAAIIEAHVVNTDETSWSYGEVGDSQFAIIDS